MKKFLICIFSLIILATFCGCAPKTEHAANDICNIESIFTERFAPLQREFVRTFDFETGKVAERHLKIALAQKCIYNGEFYGKIEYYG